MRVNKYIIITKTIFCNNDGDNIIIIKHTSPKNTYSVLQHKMINNANIFMQKKCIYICAHLVYLHLGN